MRSFEILVRTGDRWLLAAVFDDAAAAVADAKSLVERSRGQIAVRVIAVESRASDFIEWIIHEESTFSAGVTADPPNEELEAPAAVSEQPGIVGARVESHSPEAPGEGRPRARRKHRAKVARQPPRRPLVSSRVAAALFVIAILGGITVAVMRQPQNVWIFDTPEAQKPHALRNSWTGEVSR